MEKEPLSGEIQEGETAEVFKESSACQRWVVLCWMLMFWVPTPAGFVLRELGHDAIHCSRRVSWVHSQGNQEHGQCWEYCCYLQRCDLRCH